MRVIKNSVISTVHPSRAAPGPGCARYAILCVFILLTLPAPSRGQCEPIWTQRMDVPAARVNSAMAYDQVRGVVVLFGGDQRHVEGDDVLFRQIWEWDGAVWTRRTDVTGGPQVDLDDIAMTYDSWRGVMVVRHKPSGGVPAETWEFDGQAWSLPSIGGPQLRDTENLTFDSRRGVTVLWGERGIGTWEWQNGAWTFRDPGPDEFANFELAFDEARGVTLASGSVSGQSQTWTWDGLTWQQVAVDVPPRRGSHAMVYDPVRQRVLLYGGQFQSPGFDDTWSWDGTSWSFVTAGQPSGRSGHAMAYDAARDEMVTFGGEPEHDIFLSDTWTFDGAAWTRADEGEPMARFAPAMAYDTARRVAVLFGGTRACVPFRDTWQHDGARWNLLSSTGPPARYWAATTYDTLRGVVLLFGGEECAGELGDTWAWNGATWTMLSDKGPGRRSSPAMAYDGRRDVTVLFGGGPGDPEDTWEWNGTSWSSRAVGGGPSARYTPAMVYDERLGVTVLFGGAALVDGELIHYQDTWHWDGDVWSLMAQSGPEARRSASMAYDSDRQVTVLYGGDDANRDPLDDMWQWDGLEWTPVIISTPSPRRTAAMIYAPDRQAMLLFGGSDGSHRLSETWEFATASPSTGDLNCDCAVDAFDIEPFLVALFDPGRYDKLYPTCDIIFGDINADGAVNAFDIEPFIDLLFQP